MISFKAKFWKASYKKMGMPLILGFFMALISMADHANGQVSMQEHKRYLKPSTIPEALRVEYIALEQSLWQFLNKKNIKQQNQLKKVVDSHNNFIENNDLMKKILNVEKYAVLESHEWRLIKKDILEIDGYYQFFKKVLESLKNTTEYDERAFLDLAKANLRNDKTFSIPRIYQEIERIMVDQAFYQWSRSESGEQICTTQQSPHQFVYSLYTDLALTELKGYTIMEFYWMILRLYGKGNFTQEADLMRQDYEKRTERTLKLLKNVMKQADRIVWRCDPYVNVKGRTFDEITRLLQGFVENEVDLNGDETCRETCAFYQNTRTGGCFKNKFCARQPRCNGRLYHCTFIDSDMWICPAPNNSTRRYEYIEYENGRILGQKKACTRGRTKVDSWWRYLFWHCSYCFCLCDESGVKSDRYFNLKEYVSDVQNNKIVTGLRFVKANRIFHLQIQEGTLLPRGAVNESSLNWKPVDDYKVFHRNVRQGEDFHTLSYGSRAIDLDDVYTDDNSFVVTGVKFRLVGAHLNLEVQLSEFDFESGTLVNLSNNTFWKSNDNTDVSGEKKRRRIELDSPDIPTKLLIKSRPDSSQNEFIEFTNSNLDKDAAQSTVPFVDIQDVISIPPVPLSGVGIYHKGNRGSGGYVAPKIMTYDFSPHVMYKLGHNT